MPCHRSGAVVFPRHSLPEAGRRRTLAKQDLAHFLRQVNSAQVQTAHSPPQILHWTSTWNKLSEWAWPSDSDTGERVPPSDLEGHRRTHYFMAPCCLCPLLLGEMYVESKIGLAVVAPGSVRSEVSGEYIAQCARNECGYFVPLERFYARKILKVNAYKKRDAPLEPHQLNYISDLAPGHEEMLGLPQALPSSSIWSRGPRKFDHPIDTQTVYTDFNNLWARGVEEDVFWRLFVQCALCKMVMPRDVFGTVHGPVGCWMRREGTTWPAIGPLRPEANEDNASTSGDTEIVEWDDETDDEMPPLEDIEDWA
ncbi:hypothetical protein BKA70DRAFT_1238514 [Coprinopsis sp. MPI-PUGE-AT-0042]|nr:hypothetical protein BKA70DRAFT_1238514 [Coprinopsis sp. MPI-PUGE-AT-0042]